MLQSNRCCLGLRLALITGQISPEEVVESPLQKILERVKDFIDHVSMNHPANEWLVKHLNDSLKAAHPFASSEAPAENSAGTEDMDIENS